MDAPEIRYAHSGDVAIAYHVSGEAPIDLVLVTGFVSNILYGLEQPLVRRFLERLGRFARVIRFDRRGTGLSDRPRDVPTLETLGPHRGGVARRPRGDRARLGHGGLHRHRAEKELPEHGG